MVWPKIISSNGIYFICATPRHSLTTWLGLKRHAALVISDRTTHYFVNPTDRRPVDTPCKITHVSKTTCRRQRVNSVAGSNPLFSLFKAQKHERRQHHNQMPESPTQNAPHPISFVNAFCTNLQVCSAPIKYDAVFRKYFEKKALCYRRNLSHAPESALIKFQDQSKEAALIILTHASPTYFKICLPPLLWKTPQTACHRCSQSPFLICTGRVVLLRSQRYLPIVVSRVAHY